MDIKEPTKYENSLTERIMKSTSFKDSLTNPEIRKKIQILTTAVRYFLKSEKTEDLKLELQKLKLNGSIDQWVNECLNAAQEIKSLYAQLEREYRTTLRGQYPGIIAEIIYDIHKTKFDTLSTQ